MFPSIDINSFLTLNKCAETGAVTLSMLTVFDGFPAIKGFIQRIDKPSEVLNFMDWKPKEGSDGISLFPVLGDIFMENIIKLPSDSKEKTNSTNDEKS